jgi:hypothetical protein
MLTAQERGELLEQGVRAIERHLLAVEGNVKDSDLAIETRKIIVHQGVKHEIDVHVTVSNARGYDAVFVFECKNWKDKVDKNEIVIFSEKIKVATAQRGFFVARDYTADARAQAALDPRMVLLTARADELSQVFDLWDFHVHLVNDRSTTISFRYKGDDQRQDIALDMDTAVVSVKGVSIPMRQYINQWVTEARDKRVGWALVGIAAGEYPFETNEERTFGSAEVFVNGMEVDAAKIKVDTVVTIVRPGVCARVHVQGRGTAIQLEEVPVGDGKAMSLSLLNLGGGRGGDHYAAFVFDATGAMEFSCCASARMS